LENIGEEAKNLEKIGGETKRSEKIRNKRSIFLFFAFAPFIFLFYQMEKRAG